MAVKGRVLADKYRLVEELGSGGMGSVWRAEHIELRSFVAVKLIEPTLAKTAEGRSRFLREARAAGSLRSNHVASVFDYGVDDDTPFIIMELLEGESLAERLERRGPLPLSEVQDIVRQVGRALAKAHNAGIVHRDLKPENIFIVDEGDSELVKVLDFGIAKVEGNIAASVQTQTGLVMGTPFYMSPEQAEGRRQLDSRSDLWSMGVIVYEALLGKRPFDGDNLAQIILAICADELPVPSRIAAVPTGFDAWFARAAARSVEHRFASIQELVDTLGTFTDDVQSEVPPTKLWQPGPDQRLTSASDAPSSQPSTAREVDSPAASVGDSPPIDGAEQPDSEPTLIPLNRPTPLGIWGGVGIALLVVLGVGAWFFSERSSARTEPAIESATGVLNEVPSMAVRSVTADGDHTSGNPVQTASLGAAALDTTPTVEVAPGKSAAPDEVHNPRASASLSTTSPTRSSPSSLPAPSPASPVAPSPRAQPGSLPVGLRCIQHAISGRIVKASANTAGSFPCYVHTISGQLRRKN